MVELYFESARTGETHLKRKCLVFFKLDEQDGLLVVHRHEFALCVPGAGFEEVQMQQSDSSQSSTIKTRDQVRYALPFNADVGGKNVVTNGERRRNNQ